MKTIQTKEDVIYLVDSFYEKVNKDELLSPTIQRFRKGRLGNTHAYYVFLLELNIIGRRKLHWQTLSKTFTFTNKTKTL